MNETMSERLESFLEDLLSEKKRLRPTNQKMADVIGTSKSTYIRHFRAGFRRLTVQQLQNLDRFFFGTGDQNKATLGE